MPGEKSSLVDPGAANAHSARPSASDPDAVDASLEPAPQTDEPLLLPPRPAEGEPAADLIDGVHRFHLGDPNGAPQLVPPGEDLLPAVLHPFRNAAGVRNDYPIFLRPPADAAYQPLCTPLAQLLAEAASSFAPDREDARILKDNLARLELRIRSAIDGQVGPAPAADVIREAARAVERELALRGESADRLSQDLDRLIDAIPVGGSLLPFDENAPLHLYLHTARRRYADRFAQLRSLAAGLRRKLRDILAAESAKGPEGRSPGALGQAVGGGGADMFDLEALSRVLDASRSSVRMPEDRRKRIEDALATIDAFLAQADAPRIRVVHHGTAPAKAPAEDVDWTWTGDDAACPAAVTVFDSLAGEFTRLHGAIRVARLESNGQYDPSIHDAMLEMFDWRSFTREELLAIPPVLAVETDAQLAGAGLAGLSRLLLSGRPVSVLVSVHPAMNPGEDGDAPGAYRFELANLGVGHREALVNQTCATRPEHLATGFERALDAVHASLHVVATGLLADGAKPSIGSWVHAGAAMEARAHPLFHYNPEAGETWARRFDIDSNPQPEAAWPVYELHCRNADGEDESLSTAVTFADFALTEPCYRECFRVLPPSAAGERFVPLADCLSMTDDQAEGRVPFIWGADEDGRLHRLAVTRDLVLACRDRLDYWRTLQELAGVRNEHVREAVARERRKLEEAFDEERAALQRSAEERVEQARSEAAHDALQRLAAALVSGDAASLAAARTDLESAGAPATVASEQADTEPAEAEASGDEADDSPAEPAAAVADEVEEPWVNTPLCTSCNDCLNINNRLFVYNANKQAVIGDPHAGTFEELVQAAEKCPARCIHPGTPLNPDEPNLEELIERARPFNT